MFNIVSNRNRLLLGLMLIGAIVFYFIAKRSHHPEFGMIYRTRAIYNLHADDQWQSRWERTQGEVRRVLGLQQWPPDRGLQIGPARLYCFDGRVILRHPNSSVPVWEFALSSRRHVEEVTREDLRCEFYGMNDPRGTNVFGPPYPGRFTGPAWEGDAIRVGDGQVFFVRLVTNRSTVYAIQLGRWQNSTNRHGTIISSISAKYVVAQNLPTHRLIEE